MKANELMIGDWVMFDNKQLKVHDILTYSIYVDDAIGLCFFEDLEPIILTADILKKNGFVFDEIDGSYRHTDLGLWIGGRCEPFGCLISNIYVELNYVHELQHALRMCGAKKEIEL